MATPLEQVAERVVRIESRLVQLMKFLGADPYGKNEPPTKPLDNAK